MADNPFEFSSKKRTAPVIQPVVTVAPPPPPAPEQNPLLAGWTSFLDNLAKDPSLTQGLIAAGATMMQPREPGQSQMGQIGKGLVAGMGVTNERRQVEQEKGFRERLVGLQEKQQRTQEQGFENDAYWRAQEGRLAEDRAVLSREYMQEQIAQLRDLNTPESRTLRKRALEAEIAASTLSEREKKIRLDYLVAQTANMEEQVEASKARRTPGNPTGRELTGQEAIFERLRTAVAGKYAAANPGQVMPDYEADLETFQLMNPTTSRETPGQIYRDFVKLADFAVIGELGELAGLSTNPEIVKRRTEIQRDWLQIAEEQAQAAAAQMGVKWVPPSKSLEVRRATNEWVQQQKAKGVNPTDEQIRRWTELYLMGTPQ